MFVRVSSPGPRGPSSRLRRALAATVGAGLVASAVAVPSSPVFAEELLPVITAYDTEEETDPGSCSAYVRPIGVVVVISGDPVVETEPSLYLPFPLGRTRVTATATNSLATISVDFDVTVVDRERPEIVGVPADIAVAPTGPGGAVVTYDEPRARDNCPEVSLARTAGLASGSTFPLGTTIVTHTATDGSGNQQTASFRVTVGTAPTISPVPAIATTAASDLCVAVIPAPSVSRTGDPVPTVSFSPALPGLFPVGTTTVTATATNGVEPAATTTFDVVVSDTEAPRLAATANRTVDATGPAGAVVSYTTPTGSDNCPGVGVTRTAGPASGATFPVGITVVSHRATDASGISTTSSFTVTVNGAAQQLTTLIDQVTPTPPGSALADKLTAAQRALASGDVATACSSLDSFISLVAAQRGKKLTRAQADALTASARQIKRVIGCR